MVDNVSFSVDEGECLGILDESGSGKSMTCKAFLRLLDRSFEVDGTARFGEKELLSISGEEIRRLRGSQISMILQNPMACFDPLYRIGDQMAEGFFEHTSLGRGKIRTKCAETLELMRIQNHDDVLEKYPHQLSGGMLQRVMIGLALAMEPALIVADEPTTAIDSITQYEILQEFLRIKNECRTAMIFISHDLGVISQIADRVIVMHDAKITQSGTMLDVLNNPADAYTNFVIEKKMAVMNKFLQIMNPTEPVVRERKTV
ncbi:MAG: ABC transporter ATP-binding protein [Deltaproteobacteria bacterium]|nr:ABC transporter ATP-binding protein [Deltaproteobacteria bacterium]